MMAGFAIRAKSFRIGSYMNVKDPNAKSREHARQTFWVQQLLNQKSTRKRLSPEDIHARLIFLIGATLAFT